MGYNPEHDVTCLNCGIRQRSTKKYKLWRSIELYDVPCAHICPRCQCYFTDSELGIGEHTLVPEYRSTFLARPMVANVPKSELPLEVIAYTAGIIDGEGYVGIDKQCNGRWSNGDPYYYARVAVSNTGNRLISWLQSNWGGSVNHRTPSNPRANDIWVWVVSTGYSAEVLSIVLPFLVLKRRQADTVMRFSRLSSGILRNKELIAKQQDLYDEIKIYNKVGRY